MGYIACALRGHLPRHHADGPRSTACPARVYASLRRLTTPDGELLLNVMINSAGNLTASWVVQQLTTRLLSAGWTSVRSIVAQELGEKPHGADLKGTGATLVTNYLVVAAGVSGLARPRADAQHGCRARGWQCIDVTAGTLRDWCRGQGSDPCCQLDDANVAACSIARCGVDLSDCDQRVLCFWCWLTRCWAEQASPRLWQPILLAEWTETRMAR